MNRLDTIGRNAQLSRLAARLDAVTAAHGGVVLLTGEAGIGKTRLLVETELEARDRGLTVLAGRGSEGAGPFRPLVEALVPVVAPELTGHPRLSTFGPVLSRLLPGWPAAEGVADPVADPVAVFGEAVRAVLSVLAESAPGLLVQLDDLHWADPDTLAMLGYLAGRLADVPVLVVAAARDDEPGAAVVVDLVTRPGVEVLAVPRLASDEILVLAARAAGRALDAQAAEDLARSAEGLPLLAEELARSLLDSGGVEGRVPLPHSLAALTEHRLALLSPPARDVVHVAAVVGGGLDWTLLPQAAGVDEHTVAAALREAVDARLLVVDAAAAGGLRWRHALTRDAVLAGLLPPERAALARRAVHGLCPDTGQPLPMERLALVADLYRTAGHDHQAGRLLLDLARMAVRSGALCSAEQAVRTAAQLLTDEPTGLRRARLELVRVLALAGRAGEAAQEGQRLIPELDAERRVSLCLYLGRAAVVAERFSDAARYLVPVSDSADPRVLAMRAHIALGQGDDRTAAQLARQAIGAGERMGQPEAACEAWEVVGRCLRRVDPPAATDAFHRAETLAAQHDLPVWRIRALSELGAQQMLETGQPDRLQQARDLAVEAGLLATVAVLDVQLSGAASLRDGHAAAETHARRAAELADQLGLPEAGAAARYFLALGALCRGDRDGYERLLDEADRLAPESVDGRFRAAGVRAWGAWVEGELDTALRLFDEAVAVLGTSQVAPPTPFWGQWALLRTVLVPGDDSPLALLRAAQVEVQAVNRAARHYVEGVLAARAGRRDEAAERFRDGDEAAVGQTYWRAVLHLMLAEPVAHGLDVPADWLREAYALFDAAGEPALVQRCRQLMRAAGVPVPRVRGVATVPAHLRRLGVTTREYEVLGLVQQGLTNSEIAARLVLSARTVETHVARLLAKTGARNRGQLTALTP